MKHPNYGLTFARILGQDEWDPASTSVAGLRIRQVVRGHDTQAAHHNGGPTYDVKDIDLAGGTIVTVHNGDVGTNANMEYESGVASVMNIDADYGMYYMDADSIVESLRSPSRRRRRCRRLTSPDQGPELLRRFRLLTTRRLPVHEAEATRAVAPRQQPQRGTMRVPR